MREVSVDGINAELDGGSIWFGYAPLTGKQRRLDVATGAVALLAIV